MIIIPAKRLNDAQTRGFSLIKKTWIRPAILASKTPSIMAGPRLTTACLLRRDGTVVSDVRGVGAEIGDG